MFKRITENDIADKKISSLATTPTKKTAFGRSGLDAAGLKAQFDKMPLFLVLKINEIIDGIQSGNLATALKTKEGKSVGLTLENILAGKIDINVNTVEGFLSLSTVIGYALRMYRGLETGDLADILKVRDGELVTLNKRLEELGLETEKIAGLENAAKDWVRFSGGDYKDFYATSMKELDRIEENDKYIDFSGKYNRVYVNQSGGRGDTGIYCLTETPTPPVDPDGALFEHGGGKYYKTASEKISYDNFTVDTFREYGGVEINDVFAANIRFGERAVDRTDKMLILKKSGGKEASIFFKYSGEKRRKCVFETELYLDAENIIISDADPWIMQLLFLDQNSDTTDAWKLMRLNYKADENIFEWRDQNNKAIKILPKTWFNFRVECIDDTAYVIVDSMLIATRTGCKIESFGGVMLKFRTSGKVDAFQVDFDNTCVVSVDESLPSALTLSSVCQRTKQGHLRVPRFDLGTEPLTGDVPYVDEIAVPYAYVQSMQAAIIAGLERVIASQEEILGGEK